MSIALQQRRFPSEMAYDHDKRIMQSSERLNRPILHVIAVYVWPINLRWITHGRCALLQLHVECPHHHGRNRTIIGIEGRGELHGGGFFQRQLIEAMAQTL